MLFRSAQLQDVLRRADAAWALRFAVEDVQRHERGESALLVWRAYAEVRAAGLPVPEAILVHFDRWAAGLGEVPPVGKTRPAAMLRALGLAGDDKGKISHSTTAERDNTVAGEVKTKCSAGMETGTAIAEVARAFGLSVPVVKKAYYRRFPTGKDHA